MADVTNRTRDGGLTKPTDFANNLPTQAVKEMATISNRRLNVKILVSKVGLKDHLI